MTETLTAKAIHAIFQVVCINKDSVEMQERRGVDKDDLHCVFRMATTQAEITKGRTLRHTLYNLWKDSGLSAEDFLAAVKNATREATHEELRDEVDDDD